METKNRILILDDDLALGGMLQEFISRACQCEAIHISHPDDLWQILEEKTFDAFFLDYKLPGTNGIEILEQLASRPQHRLMPTIMMTGEGNETTAARAIQIGALDYLVKSDLDFTVLPALVEKAFQRRAIEQIITAAQHKVQYQAMLLNNVRDAIIVWERDNTITYWNQAAERLFGIPAEKMLGQPVNKAYFSLFEQPAQRSAVDESITLLGDRRFTHPTRGTVWISSQISRLYSDDDGRTALGSMDVVRDITAFKMEQETLARSQHFIRQILETVPHIIYILNLRVNQFRYISPKAEKILELPVAESQDASLDLLTSRVHPDDVEHIHAHYQRMLKQPPAAAVTLEYRLQLSTNEWRWLRNVETVFSYDGVGDPVEVIGVCEDITSRKEMEEKLSASQIFVTQTSRMAAIGQLASSIAHQISNPLTTIIADAQLLLRGTYTTEEMEESLKAIQTAGWRMQEVIELLMKFSKPSTTTKKLLPVNDTIAKAILLAGSHLHSAQINLKTDLLQPSPMVVGFEQRLVDLWVNLLLAEHSTDQEISPKNIWIHSRLAEGELIEVIITDDGERIPPDQLDSIFEPQLIPRGIGRGNGIELSLCREIVRQHNGGIQVTSEEGRTIFRISLPTGAEGNGHEKNSDHRG
ncbi:MAG: PAS domain S-box protein [Bellilinea sp.]